MRRAPEQKVAFKEWNIIFESDDVVTNKVRELSLENSFLLHEPKTASQEHLKKAIVAAIGEGLSCFEAKAGEFHYPQKLLKAPIRAHQPWWTNGTKTFWTRGDLIAAMTIKYLVEEQDVSVESAWRIVCDEGVVCYIL